MKTFAIVAVTAVMGLASGFADAGDVAVSCPTNIETSQTLRSASPSGWEATRQVDQREQDRQGKRNLLGASLSMGPPVETFILAPVDAGRGKDGLQGYRWNLVRSDGTYLTCFYDHTTVQLMLKLEAGFKFCEVLKDPNTGDVSATCAK